MLRLNYWWLCGSWLHRIATCILLYFACYELIWCTTTFRCSQCVLTESYSNEQGLLTTLFWDHLATTLLDWFIDCTGNFISHVNLRSAALQDIWLHMRELVSHGIFVDLEVMSRSGDTNLVLLAVGRCSWNKPSGFIIPNQIGIKFGFGCSSNEYTFTDLDFWYNYN